MSGTYWSRTSRFALFGLLTIALGGCGDDAGSSKKEGAGPAGGTAAAAAGVDIGAGMSAEPGGIGPGAAPGGGSGGGAAAGMQPGGAPASGGKSTSSAATSARDLFVYIPESITLASGASIPALSDPKAIGGSQLLSQFGPVLETLARAGLNVDQIEHVWSGTNRSTGDLLMCARTRSEYNPSNVIQSLGASAESEKVGRAAVHDLPTHPTNKNAIALVDTKTLLLGRRDTVIAALKNPKPAAVRWGLDAMNIAQPHYWIAGDELAVDGARVPGSGPALTSWDVMAMTRARATAFGFGKGGAVSSPAGPSGGGTPDPMGGAGAASDMTDLPGDAGFPGSMPGGMPGMGSGGVSQGVEIVIGLNFATEGAATTAEAQANEAIKIIQALSAPKAPGAGGPGMMPGYGPTGGTPPPGGTPLPGAAPPNSGDFIEANPMPDAAGMGSGGIPSQVSGKATRTKENVRIALTLPAVADAKLFQMLGNALQASGASAMGDGLFNGTLGSLSKAVLEWAAAKPDELRGVKRIGEQPVHQGYSWMTRLLPFVGRGELYNKFDFEKSWSEGNNLSLTMNVIPAFLNPADQRTTFPGHPYAGMGLTHFVGMAGLEDRRDVIAAALPRTDPRAGMFGYDQIARPAEITDGTSQTIMLIGAGEVVAPWVQGGGATVRGARTPYFGGPGSFGSRGLQKPGTLVLFADGSARTISADIDPEVFKAMCTIHGAEQIDMSRLSDQQQ